MNTPLFSIGKAKPAAQRTIAAGEVRTDPAIVIRVLAHN